ncbi:ATP-binding cassette domain-containing protein [Paenibacillus mendelii]|uniref:ATP-binding cassette domain-containing protein n=1 Tax=Paenibacillus mendelii TaxID=206163 RepID=A0ABV6J4S2_9BACL|nr:ATP-binding cassette domain-containing protein [Paenibacillus mendelii]MCQ6562026.1 ATP-binding cassette domain-containing protein [Paenibacillus mendelii]
MNPEGLTIRDVRKTFGAFQALSDIQIDIPKGKFTCLLGPSGCGKTTLLRIISGLERPDSGTVLLGGRDITPLPAAKRNFGIVFQSYALFPNMTVSANIAYGLKGKIPRRDVEAKLDEMLRLMDLEAIRDRYPSQISGGQQQRVALARAVALSPEVLLLDEPLSALDAKVRVKLREELCLLQQRLGITTVMVTHDQEEALTMADRIIVMDHGQVVQIGTPQEVYDRPNTPFVADFIGAINFFPVQEKNNPLYAMRPEHIIIAPDGAEDAMDDGFRSFRAVVQHIEFRGAFYRISLLPIDENGSAAVTAVTVDVSAQVAQQYRLERDTVMTLQLPADRLLQYPPKAVGAYAEARP